MVNSKRAPRKTNQELNERIFSATINILNTEGYEQVTFNNIAKEAGTSRPVLYRHWDSAFELLLAAEDYFDDEEEDTFENLDFSDHSLRENLIVSLSHFDGSQSFLRAILIELGNDNPVVHKYFAGLHKQQLYIMERMLSAAQLKNEIKHTVTDNVKLLPFNLMLYQAMVDQNPVTKGWIENLVDTIVLPAIMDQQNK
ncbi:TetR/AcrR family transcriptional regulator [Lentilactobacillus sp. SPB1-3]|uniref:TetR/AcrR family transcriptional regulator n=1 Tax=Lentilactobacillus terminaliae TaxID=3003483 RepID=A0ACD5DEK7_9LACO|nr:TetR/AcrR family transcriptional regulator [Lentilactobacillus sp. SPB1-3]MCZ0976334.1 TetR/AcrR family transcriptional regulator [Lentilactobacillus sp. SPB1-3]